MCAFQLPLIVESPSIAPDQELGQVLEGFFVELGKFGRGVQTPKLFQFVVGTSCYLMKLHILTGQVFLVHAVIDVIEQLVFLTRQSVGQKIIDTLILCRILPDMTEINFNVKFPIFQ